MYRYQGKLYKTEGIILSRKNVGEADRILAVFTREYGKLRLIAKGIRRVTSRRAPHLEIFTQCALVVHRGTSLDSITEVTPITLFDHIRKNLDRISIAYFYLELVGLLLPEKQEHADVYELLIASLTNLNNPGAKDIHEKSREFTLRLLWMLGFLPEGRILKGNDLQQFVESIAERRLKTPKIIRELRS